MLMNASTVEGAVVVLVAAAVTDGLEGCEGDPREAR
jgi:hypothetical protein